LHAGHGARTNNVNILEGRQGFEIAELIKTLVPKEAMLTKLSLVSCNSGDCMAGITNMVTDVKELFNKSLIVKGYQGTVNANDNGKVIIVANGKLGMAPSDIDSLKQKADELDQQLEKLTDKMVFGDECFNEFCDFKALSPF
jgi:hypothetical protein